MTNQNHKPWWQVLCYLPVTMGVLVALLQIALTYTAELTPAKGGGFGLFSTVDKLGNRNVRAYLITPEKQIPFAIPPYVPASQPLRKPIYRAASLPSDRHLRVIIDDLLTKPYAIPIKGIRVEVWKRAFDPQTHTISRIKIKEMTVLKPSHDGD